MLESKARVVKKELRQFITMYQMLIEFPIVEAWLEIQMKFAKEDVDNMFDDVNNHLIEVCDDYLKTNKLPLDKFQLSTIIMDLFTTTLSDLEYPFYVKCKESKGIAKEYVKNNKEAIAKVEKLKKEAEELEKKQAELRKRKTVQPVVEKTNTVQPKIVQQEPINPTQTRARWDGNTDNLWWTFTF